jgi:hypothetical protein
LYVDIDAACDRSQGDDFEKGVRGALDGILEHDLDVFFGGRL